jgi:hypothetical protein
MERMSKATHACTRCHEAVTPCGSTCPLCGSPEVVPITSQRAREVLPLKVFNQNQPAKQGGLSQGMMVAITLGVVVVAAVGVMKCGEVVTKGQAVADKERAEFCRDLARTINGEKAAGGMHAECTKAGVYIRWAACDQAMATKLERELHGRLADMRMTEVACDNPAGGLFIANVP